jgi:hypothetical protein
MRFSTSSTTLRTTARAVDLDVSGMAEPRETSVEARWTSGSMDSISSGSSSSERTPSRSMASRCMTWTTVEGK